ncbi:DEAD-domain-containing protein [Fomitiporia mediterranea MF3/22]|uniref:DEAD-domain-containing protein n=1 Tax=Fomitiporia mediterranea (strain MF3/22) TaxID=694068 RepID=UPI00044087D4|nr:DEAD-domain-containing protein [Fomitiporia mediterranea MF3/22]EJD02885.1 DEAD-domain-containing protein [Fomitiporia mediterranea MF3/22]
MDDGIILNIAESPEEPIRRRSNVKGGRWTDRVKAKRVQKRKSTTGTTSKVHQTDLQPNAVELDESPRPAKRSRQVPPQHQESRHSEPDRQSKSANTGRAPQIISSLFTFNPKVDVESIPRSPSKISKPSNAPLTDKSTFTGLGLDPLIVTHLASKMNISAPTSIQREALPPLLSSLSEDTSERDVFIQSQTGSGKTLSYLLPILQDLLPLSSLSYIDRSIGTLAIIIAPTRELAKQISDVLEQLLSLRLRPPDENVDDATASTRLTRWLVSGLLIGGENRTHEKARLRKGLPILVSTPGRLLDHLQNTSSFNVGKCRWLVLDEADRLMDLGFEESIKGILQALEGRRRLAIQAVEEGKSMEAGGWDWKRRRRTILCSATIKENVQHLAGTALVKPIIVKAMEIEEPLDSTANPDSHAQGNDAHKDGQKFTPPSQLLQKYVVAPLKLRLVALVALLRTLLSQSHARSGTKIIVFLSCTDSVDYHWKLLGGSSIDGTATEADESEDSEAEDQDDSEDKLGKRAEERIALASPFLPQTSIYRLHGSLPLQTRQASLKGFASPQTKSQSKDSKDVQSSSSILLCTSVASRGLDLPLVRAVIQYDLPTEGGATEYVHRVGRTARVGKGGEAWSFVLPSEQGWVHWIEERMHDTHKTTDGEKKKGATLVSASVESVLKSGFGGKGEEFEERATQVQLAFERWVLKRKEHGDLARKAFQSHMRAYATHPSDEKHMFHIRNLHLGHLAKAFALRDAPGNITQKQGGRNSSSTRKSAKTKARRRNQSYSINNADDKDNLVRKTAKSVSQAPSEDKQGTRRKNNRNLEHDTTAEARMQEVVRRQGRLVKKGGVLMASGTDEFQVAGGYDLEKLVGSR